MDNRLRELRKNKGLGLIDASNELNITKSTLANYEKGITTIKADVLKRASNFYNVTIDYILKESNLKNNSNDKIKKAIENNPNLLKIWENILEYEEIKKINKKMVGLNKETLEILSKLIELINS